MSLDGPSRRVIAEPIEKPAAEPVKLPEPEPRPKPRDPAPKPEPARR